MNQLCLYIPIKPLSVNDAKYPSTKKIRTKNGKMKIVSSIQCTKEANFFKRDMRMLLYGHMDQITTFTSAIKSEFIEFTCRYIFWIPKNELITKRGTVSKTSLDLDNCVKYLQDSVFDFMHNKNPLINDAMILKYSSVDKRISPINEFGVTIHLMTHEMEKSA